MSKNRGYETRVREDTNNGGCDVPGCRDINIGTTWKYERNAKYISALSRVTVKLYKVRNDKSLSRHKSYKDTFLHLERTFQT